MNDVSSPVLDFSIAFFPPGLLATLAFCLMLTLTLAAAAWLGWRHHLRKHGVRTEGTVTACTVRTGRTRTSEFSASERTYSRNLTISYQDGTGTSHNITGFHYSIGSDDASAPRVGSSVPVYYNPTYSDHGVYYNPSWHYPAPLLALALLLPILWMSLQFCYDDLRVQNSLALAGWSEDEYRHYQETVSDCNGALYESPGDADALERRGDAQFAMLQFGDAISDYSDALRLRPERKELRLKRAKAQWLDGRDSGALRDWLAAR